MIGFLFVLLVFTRQIIIEPSKDLVFYEYVGSGELFKLIYSTRSNVEVSLYDPEDRLITKTSTKIGALYTKSMNEGKIKMIVRNQTKELCFFSYKCPDPNKELAGHLGYIKDTDLVSELTRLLDELIEGQTDLIERTVKHKEMVSKSRSWVRILMIFEFFLTAFAVYILHQDFISMFEKKQSL